MSSKSSHESNLSQVDNVERNSHVKERKGKPTPIDTAPCFQTDETPTPTKILKMADMELFHDLKDNPFDVHFRKATEAVKQGANNMSTSINQQGHSGSTEDSLNTPQLFCVGESTPQVLSVTTNNYSSQVSASRPVILKVNSNLNQAASNIPIASVQPVMANFKPIAPSPTFLQPSSSNNTDNAMLLLKFATGETIKLSNLPFEKAESHQPQTQMNPINQETRIRLKRTISSHNSAVPTLTRENSFQNSKHEVSLHENNGTDEKSELKERNRMSAQRSRQKKRHQSQALGKACLNFQKTNSDLNKENKILREEIIALKTLLAPHLHCNVTRAKGLKDLLLGKLEPHLVEVHNEQNELIIEEMPDTIEDTETIPIVVEENKLVNLPVSETITFLTDRNKVAFNLPPVPSPPQTVPQDLRVDTRLQKSDEVNEESLSQINIKPVALKSRPLKITDIQLFPQSSGSSSFLVKGNPSWLSTDRDENNYNKHTENNTNNGYKGSNSSIEVKQSLALHCQQVASRKNETKERKVTVAKRLKDKLQILKQKMEEDNNFPINLEQSQKQD